MICQGRSIPQISLLAILCQLPSQIRDGSSKTFLRYIKRNKVE